MYSLIPQAKETTLRQGKRKKIVAKVCIGFRAIQVWLEPSFSRACCSQ